MPASETIPEDVQITVRQILGGYHKEKGIGMAISIAILSERARATAAERERCAKVAEERAAICADAVAKIEAGELYPNTPTARATEECARLEAAHIARLIRGEPGAIRSGGHK